jgi:hypothetical protein
MQKRLDSSIQFLRGMLGDQTNELESGQRRALSVEISKLKRLKKQPKLTRAEIYRVVGEVAETVSTILK